MVKKLLREKTLISDQPEKFAENSAKSCPKYIPMPPERKRNEDISKAVQKAQNGHVGLEDCRDKKRLDRLDDIRVHVVKERGDSESFKPIHYYAY